MFKSISTKCFSFFPESFFVPERILVNGDRLSGLREVPQKTSSLSKLGHEGVFFRFNSVNPSPRKEKHQNVVLKNVKILGSNLHKLKTLGSGVFVLFATSSQCLSKVCSCFLKVFHFMLSRVILSSATNNKQQQTQKANYQRVQILSSFGCWSDPIELGLD